MTPATTPDELLHLARQRGLRYPIATKGDFVRQMTESGDQVVFRRMSYDAAFAASLIPEFFFPVDSEDDLMEKATELLMARGLLPLAARPGGRP